MKDSGNLPQLPDWPYRILKPIIQEDFLEELMGDLEERFHENCSRHNPRKARLLYLLDTLALIRPIFFKSPFGYQKLNSLGMFKNYFKIGVRNILKYKLFSFINIFGLAAAMSVCMFIILLLVDQKSYDNFHQEDHLIYRIIGQPDSSSNHYATTAYSVAEELQQGYAFIEQTASLRRGVGGEANFGKKTVELRGYFASESFLNLLSFPLLAGDPASSLEAPNSMVITQSKARQLFGDELAMGKIIQFDDRGLNILDDEGDTPPVDWGNYTITGIIDDAAYQSHLKFDALISASSLAALYQANALTDLTKKWNAYFGTYTYVKVNPGTSETQLQLVLASFSSRIYENIEGLETYAFSAQNIREITPGPMLNNAASFRLPMFMYYILSVLAGIILFMAVINYTNLSVARSLIRVKEIGIRKVNGANRRSLMTQFLMESVITSMIALVLALMMLGIMKKAFLTLWANQYLQLELSWNIVSIGFFVAFSLVTGLIAGFYPSLVLSRKVPMEALRQQANASQKQWGLQKLLNVGQLVVSLLFIVSSMVVYNQFKHYISYDYGFDTENVLNIPLQSNDWQHLKTEMGQVTGVTLISACEYLPAMGVTDHLLLEDKSREDELLNLQLMRVDDSFMENLNLKLLAGAPIASTDQRLSKLVINQAAVEKLGFDNPIDAVGSFWTTRQGNEVRINGVVSDFRSTLLINGDDTRPLALSYDASSFNYLNVRISGTHQAETLKRLEKAWEKVDPKRPFIYQYFDQELANTNLFIMDVVTIIGYLAFLAIVIACLGLLGIATYTTQRKTKEVGIRKVLGAGEWQVIMVLSGGFLKLLLLSVVVAAPLSYFANRFWLDNLPNRVDFSFLTVLLGTFILLILGLLTISSQTIRVARLNPVDSLKDE